MSYYKTGSEDYDLWKQQQLNEPSNDFSSPQNEKEAIISNNNHSKVPRLEATQQIISLTKKLQ